MAPNIIQDDQELCLVMTTGQPSIADNQELILVMQVLGAAIVAETQLDAYPAQSTLAGTFVRFHLRNYAGTVPTAGAYPVPVTATTAAGSISQNLWPNYAISPAGTFYTVELWSNGRLVSSANYIINGPGDLSTMTAIPSSSST
jgi:hypothetical protein